MPRPLPKKPAISPTMAEAARAANLSADRRSCEGVCGRCKKACSPSTDNWWNHQDEEETSG